MSDTTHWDDLIEENRILRGCLEEIISRHPVYAYASASSHPDTNVGWDHVWRAERALRALKELQQKSAGGSE